MTIVIGVVNILVLFSVAFMLWKKETSVAKPFYWPSLVLKLSCGIGLGVLYTYFYTINDSFAYFDDARVLTRFAKHDFSGYVSFLWRGDESFAVWKEIFYQQPRSLFLVKIVSLINLITADNYWVTALYLSFFSFLGAWSLVKVLLRLNHALLPAIVLALLLFPSVVLWSSGVTKESLAMGSLFFIVAIFLQCWLRERVGVGRWMMLLLSLWLLWNLKYYYIAVLLPVLVTALIMKLVVQPYFSISRWWVSLLLWSVLFIVLIGIVSLLHPNFYPERFLTVLLNNYLDYTAISAPGDFIEYTFLQATISSVVYYAPKALLSGLFRPFLWEAGNLFQVATAFENLVLVILFITAIPQWKQNVSSGNRLLILTTSVYIILLCIFLALSTPNFGTLVRFRIGFLPFFVLLISANNPLVNGVVQFMQRSFRRLVQK